MLQIFTMASNGEWWCGKFIHLYSLTCDKCLAVDLLAWNWVSGKCFHLTKVPFTRRRLHMNSRHNSFYKWITRVRHSLGFTRETVQFVQLHSWGPNWLSHNLCWAVTNVDCSWSIKLDFKFTCAMAPLKQSPGKHLFSGVKSKRMLHAAHPQQWFNNHWHLSERWAVFVQDKCIMKKVI